jgi:hypothetical protein
MTHKELKRIFSKGECLSLDALRLYNDGKLNKKSMHEVEMHLLECNLCSGAVDGLNSKRIAEVNKLSEHIQRRLAVYMNTPPPVPIMRRFGLLIVSGLLLLGVGGTCIYLAQDKKEQQPVLTDSSATNTPKNSSTGQSDNNAMLVSSQSPVTIPLVPGNEKTQEQETGTQTKIENLPADLPGQQKTFTVKEEGTTTATITPASSGQNLTGNTTRTENSPVRVKSVQIYPAVTHNDKQTRKDAKDGQLGKPSGNSSSGFELDEMPFYPGGNDALRNYIISNFKPTAADREKLTRFATGIRFIVNSKTGAITAPEISFSISPEIDKELLRVINSLPNYTPGKKRGEVEVMIGITFE